jgi:RNA polymerase sigma-54 factor
MTKMQLTPKLEQRLAMSQQLRQAISLLQYNSLDLKQLIQQQLETNPLLEVDESEILIEEDKETIAKEDDRTKPEDYTAAVNYSNRYNEINDENSLENYASPISFRDHLLAQVLLCNFDSNEQIVAEAIIDSLDECGHLTMSLPDIKSLLIPEVPISLASMMHILTELQGFDPLGVCSHDVRECLLIQLEALPETIEGRIAKDILCYCFDNISASSMKKSIKKLSVSTSNYAAAIALLRSLNPHPGLLYANEVDVRVEPELYVKKIKNSWQVFLTDSILTKVKVNENYQNLLKKQKNHKSYEAMNKELLEAQWLIKGLLRRNETLLAVANCIVEVQKDFLEHGHAFMKPMNIADVAQALSLHESTVSRVTTGKYILTPKGIFELKFFFPSHLKTRTGEDCSDMAVKVFIKEIIDKETRQHPLSDSEIAVVLQAKGIRIARRTVTKYREAMKILSSYQRQPGAAKNSEEVIPA